VVIVDLAISLVQVCRSIFAQDTVGLTFLLWFGYKFILGALNDLVDLLNNRGIESRFLFFLQLRLLGSLIPSVYGRLDKRQRGRKITV